MLFTYEGGVVKKKDVGWQETKSTHRRTCLTAECPDISMTAWVRNIFRLKVAAEDITLRLQRTSFFYVFLRVNHQHLVSTRCTFPSPFPSLRQVRWSLLSTLTYVRGGYISRGLVLKLYLPPPPNRCTAGLVESTGRVAEPCSAPRHDTINTRDTPTNIYRDTPCFFARYTHCIRPLLLNAEMIQLYFPNIFPLNFGRSSSEWVSQAFQSSAVYIGTVFFFFIRS